MPMARAIAPAMDASGIPSAAAPKSTPTANPSGMLCRVIARTSSVVRCNVSFFVPSFSSMPKLMCRCGVNRSSRNKNIAPRKKPTAAGIHFMVGYNRSDISIAGFSSDQKLAATITPPVKPSIGSRTPRFMLLKKKTNEAPAAVTNQVNVVAMSAE